MEGELRHTFIHSQLLVFLSGQLNNGVKRCQFRNASMFTEKAFVRSAIQPDKLFCPTSPSTWYFLSFILTSWSPHTGVQAYVPSSSLFLSKTKKKKSHCKAIYPDYVCSNSRLKGSINLQCINPPIVQRSAKWVAISFGETTCIHDAVYCLKSWTTCQK